MEMEEITRLGRGGGMFSFSGVLPKQSAAVSSQRWSCNAHCVSLSAISLLA